MKQNGQPAKKSRQSRKRSYDRASMERPSIDWAELAREKKNTADITVKETTAKKKAASKTATAKKPLPKSEPKDTSETKIYTSSKNPHYFEWDHDDVNEKKWPSEVDEAAIRRAVDEKIIIKSEELKKQRNSKINASGLKDKLSKKKDDFMKKSEEESKKRAEKSAAKRAEREAAREAAREAKKAAELEEIRKGLHEAEEEAREKSRKRAEEKVERQSVVFDTSKEEKKLKISRKKRNIDEKTELLNSLFGKSNKPEIDLDDDDFFDEEDDADRIAAQNNSRNVLSAKYKEFIANKSLSDFSSQFRRNSANWRDDDDLRFMSDNLDRELGAPSDNPIIRLIQSIGGIKVAITAMGIMVLTMSVLTTSVYAKYVGIVNRTNAFANMPFFDDGREVEIVSEFTREEMQQYAARAAGEASRVKTLSLVLTSVEKDLKIKLVDDRDNLMRGVAWSATVVDSAGFESSYKDDDKDGIIHLTDISAGDYSVRINESDDLVGYKFPQIGQSVSVKAKIEYKIIANIRDEIRKESEIDVAKEDTNGNKPADVESGSRPNDTVAFVESSVLSTGETYVEAYPDLSKTAKVTTRMQALAEAFDSLLGRNFSRDKVLGMPILVADNRKNEVSAKYIGTSLEKEQSVHGHMLGDDPPTDPEPTEPPTVTPDPTTDPEPTDPPTVTPDPTTDPEPTDPPTVTPDPTTDPPPTIDPEPTGPPPTIDPEPTEPPTVTPDPTTEPTQVPTQAPTATAEPSPTIIVTTTPTATPTLKPTITPTITPTPVPVTSISLSPSSLSLAVGNSASLSVTVYPDNATDKSYYFTTSDPSVASVSDSGTVTARHSGTATVSARTKDGGHTATCSVTVASEEKPSVTLSCSSTNIKVGGETSISALVTPVGEKVDKWEVGDSDIILISASENTCKVTGRNPGSTYVRATTESGATASITITVGGAKEGSHSPTAQLFDSRKNALYVYENGNYRLAKYADYTSGRFSKYYRKESGKIYTGWQTINGRTYYYKSDHTYVTGTQIIGGVEYHFGNDGVMTQINGTLGIDISKYQPSVNWQSVRASGIKFVIIRCGYRGSASGVLVQDPYFTSHIKGAKSVGLKVGVYFFSTALNQTEAIEEASMCAELCDGYNLDLPVFLDVENSPRPGYDNLPVEVRTANIKAFCSTIESAGYKAGVYANKTWFTNLIKPSELAKYTIWLAQYNPSGPTYSGRYDIWQFTSKGRVNGIPGNVDMDQSYIDKDTKKALLNDSSEDDQNASSDGSKKDNQNADDSKTDAKNKGDTVNAKDEGKAEDAKVDTKAEDKKGDAKADDKKDDAKADDKKEADKKDDSKDAGKNNNKDDVEI